MPGITPCLWFDTEGEEAATFYTSVFPNSRILDVARYGAAGPRPEGTVMTVSFELDGRTFVALNGGPDGVSWQIVPTALPELLGDPDPERSQRAMAAMLKMKKIEIDAVERAAGQ